MSKLVFGSFDIKNQVDVFKFALPLHDYLCQSGRVKEARALEHLVDACFPDDAQSLEAHQKAHRQIRDTVFMTCHKNTGLRSRPLWNF